MSEIEKESEEQAAFRLREQAADARVIAAREKATAWHAKMEKAAEDRIRAIAREEIKAALEPMPKVYVVKTTPINQEGGDRNQLDRRQDREDKSPPAVEAPTAGDTTALARRLAEELSNLAWHGVAPITAIEALTEARKAGLIE